MSKLNTNQIIELITRDEDVRVSTLEIAKHILAGSKQKTIGNVNKSLVRTIRQYINDFQGAGKIGFQSLFNTSGKPTEYIELNEQQTNLLFMSMRNSNPIVWQFKVALARRFTEMKKFILAQHNAEWIQHRSSGKIVTKRITALFDASLDEAGKSHDKFRFSNLQNEIYKAALGKTHQKLRKELNIPKQKIIRDYLSPKELERISLLQSMVEMMLDKHEHVTDTMITNAIIHAGNTLHIAANCPLALNDKGAA